MSLDIRPEQVDLHRFERLVRIASEGGDARRRAELLREGLASGEARPLRTLPSSRSSRSRSPGSTSYERLRGRSSWTPNWSSGATSARRELETLVAEHPLRERLRGQLMLALYRGGRQAEALEAYRLARETLVDELGIDPSPELQQLEQAILRHDQELDLPARVVPPPAGPDRRKTVTILFTDVSIRWALGSPGPRGHAGSDEAVLRLLRTIVERHGGTVERFIGDAAMAVFGVPQQHEDDALRAVRAATELRQGITGLNADLQRDHGVAIQIRTAINTGEVVVRYPASGEPFATGIAINVAIKLHEAALPGEIVLGRDAEPRP